MLSYDPFEVVFNVIFSFTLTDGPAPPLPPRKSKDVVPPSKPERVNYVPMIPTGT